jgi:hypothetical protein
MSNYNSSEHESFDNIDGVCYEKQQFLDFHEIKNNFFNLTRLTAKEQQSKQMQKQINALFEQAIILIKQDSDLSLITFAAFFGNVRTINYLLTNYLDILKKQQNNLSSAILWVVEKNHYEALQLLLSNQDVLNIIINKCPNNLAEAIKKTANIGHIKSLKLLLTSITRSKVTTQICAILNNALNDIAIKHGTNSDIYKIVALYVDVTTKNKNNITIKRLEEIIQLAYEQNLYTILVVIKDEFKPTAALTREAIAAAKQAVKPTQNSSIIQNICKDILLQVEGQWKADNRMIYGNIIGFLTADKFDPYNYFTKLELDQIKQENNSKLENKLSVRKFLSAIKGKLSKKFEHDERLLESLIGRVEKITEILVINPKNRLKMIDDYRNTKLYTDIIMEFSEENIKGI